ncbi:MAG TPA: hypothetical protein ENK57_12020 [Polyangiaceae bacterium]|nr:hypothetical protein [Polyangiaceae bacterium]
MADFLVIKSARARVPTAGLAVPPFVSMEAGRVISDSEFDVTELAAQGVPLVVYSPVTMGPIVEAFGRQKGRPKNEGDLLALLLAGGAIGGSGTDELVKVDTADDTTAGDLVTKLVAGANVTLTASAPGNQKLTISAAGGSTTFVGLTDTAGAITANQFARANAGGTSVDFFDLFGSVNTWNVAQTFNGQINLGANVVPTANQSFDIGTDPLRLRRVQGQIASFVSPAGISTVALPANTARGGLIAGTQGGAGTNTHRLEGGGFPAIACIGNAATNNVAGIATLEATRGGAIAFGSAYAYGTGSAIVSASGYSAFTAGYAYGPGNSSLLASGAGSLAFGYANARAAGSTVTQQATANGAFVAGFARQFSSTGTQNLQATGNGAFAQGYMRGAGTGAGRLEATAGGAFAQGLVRTDTTNNGRISAYGAGSFAQGYARAPSAGSPATIEAVGRGAFAQGYAQSTTIRAGGDNSVQFGPGTNNLADSLQVGSAGLRFKGTTGAPAAPQNGDFWRAGAFTYLRSDGVTWTFDQSAAFTRNATIVEDRTLLASASATVTNNNNVLAALISDLQTIGILG